MGKMKRRSCLCMCWLSFFILVGLLSPCHSFCGSDNRVVKADKDFVFFGDNITIWCNMTKVPAQDLFFDRKSVDIRYVDTVKTGSICLRFPVESPQDAGIFVCYLRLPGTGYPCTVGHERIEADYPVAQVQNVSCVVFNWMKMNCTWDLGLQPKDISVTFKWNVAGRQFNTCKPAHQTNTTCTLPRRTFKPYYGHRFQVQVEVHHTKNNASVSSGPIDMRTKALVKPAAVKGLKKTWSNATCVKLGLNHSDLWHNKAVFMYYSSQWDPTNWVMHEAAPFMEGRVERMLCGLTPFTVYNISVAVQPVRESGDGVDGFLSNWRNISVRTDPSVPEVAPETCPSCYSEAEDPCEGEDCHAVQVYWKPIPKQHRHNQLAGYSMYVPGRTTVAQNNAASDRLELNQDRGYNVQLYAITVDNQTSKTHSSLFIPSVPDKPEGPDSVVVETHYLPSGTWSGVFTVSWSAAASPASDGFAVATCRVEPTMALPCQSEGNALQWWEIPGTATSFNFTVRQQGQRLGSPDSYIVGVARQVQRGHPVISSGLTWVPCFYLKDAVPRNAPQKVKVSPGSAAGTLRVTWDYRTCDKMADDAYVTRFVIFYCSQFDAVSGKCRLGEERQAATAGAAGHMVLTDLEEGDTYLVSVAAESQWGLGQRSEAVNHTVPTSSFDGMPLVAVGIAVVVIGVFGTWKIRKCWIRKKGKFASPDIIEPPVISVVNKKLSLDGLYYPGSTAATYASDQGAHLPLLGKAEAPEKGDCVHANTGYVSTEGKALLKKGLTNNSGYVAKDDDVCLTRDDVRAKFCGQGSDSGVVSDQTEGEGEEQEAGAAQQNDAAADVTGDEKDTENRGDRAEVLSEEIAKEKDKPAAAGCAGVGGYVLNDASRFTGVVAQDSSGGTHVVPQDSSGGTRVVPQDTSGGTGVVPQDTSGGTGVVAQDTSRNTGVVPQDKPKCAGDPSQYTTQSMLSAASPSGLSPPMPCDSHLPPPSPELPTLHSSYCPVSGALPPSQDPGCGSEGFTGGGSISGSVQNGTVAVPSALSPSEMPSKPAAPCPSTPSLGPSNDHDGVTGDGNSARSDQNAGVTVPSALSPYVTQTEMSPSSVARCPLIPSLGPSYDPEGKAGDGSSASDQNAAVTGPARSPYVTHREMSPFSAGPGPSTPPLEISYDLEGATVVGDRTRTDQNSGVAIPSALSPSTAHTELSLSSAAPGPVTPWLEISCGPEGPTGDGRCAGIVPNASALSPYVDHAKLSTSSTVPGLSTPSLDISHDLDHTTGHGDDARIEKNACVDVTSLSPYVGHTQTSLSSAVPGPMTPPQEPSCDPESPAGVGNTAGTLTSYVAHTQMSPSSDVRNISFPSLWSSCDLEDPAGIVNNTRTGQTLTSAPSFVDMAQPQVSSSSDMPDVSSPSLGPSCDLGGPTGSENSAETVQSPVITTSAARPYVAHTKMSTSSDVPDASFPSLGLGCESGRQAGHRSSPENGQSATLSPYVAHAQST